MQLKDLPNLSKTQISKTNIWDGETGNIIITTEVSYGEGEDIKYKVIINGVEVKPFSELVTTPTTIVTQVSKDLFEVGDNALKLIVVDTSGGESLFEYNITKEDRDTFTFKRTFDFKEDYITDENIEVIYGEGITLKNIGVGEVNISIPTEGKSTIKSITVEDNDKQELIEVPLSMDKISVIGEGATYKKKIIPSEWERSIEAMAVK